MPHTLTSNRRFTTLLLREWLQNRRAWLLLTAAPPLVMLALLSLGHMDISFDDGDALRQMAQLPPVGLALLTMAVAALLCFVLAWLSALLQVPGLARRDQQDRSIEFWLSLPIGHTPALAAPLLSHLLLFPLAALALGGLAGLALSLLTVARFASLGDWFTLPWGLMLGAGLALLARTALGLVLATLWLSPLILLTMVASAWLKRWGLPALVAGLALLAGVLDKLYGNPVITDLGQRLLTGAGRSFVAGHSPGGLRFTPGSDAIDVLRVYPAWAAGDAWHSVQALADPVLLLAMAVSAGCFALLILRRQRG
jgi:ABC-2 type transport system permease protein